MREWQETPLTSPLRALEIARQIVERNEFPADEIAAQVVWLIGQTLIKTHYTMLLSTSLDKAAQYNLDTLPMVEATLSELSVMASLTMSIVDLLRTSMLTSIQSQWILQNRHDVMLFVRAVGELLRECLHYHNLG